MRESRARTMGNTDYAISKIKNSGKKSPSLLKIHSSP